MVQKLPLNLVPENHKLNYLRMHREINKIRSELENFEPVSKEQNKWIKEKLQAYSKLYVEIQILNDKIINKKAQ